MYFKKKKKIYFKKIIYSSYDYLFKNVIFVKNRVGCDPSSLTKIT